MGRYIKNNSVFTLRKRIQNLENGSTILERDWTTLGERRRFGKGKTPIYNDGNFIFTRNNIQLPSRRNKASSDSVELKYEDVKDAKSNVNNVELNTNSNDIRSFAYYGSCVDLVDKSITNIIMNFPGCIAVTNRKITYPVYNNEGDSIIGYEPFKEHNNGKEMFVVDNPFNIDILSKEANLGEYDNVYRYMCESYEQYEIIRYENVDGKLREIDSCNIVGYDVDYQFDECGCNNRDQWYNYGNVTTFGDDVILRYPDLHDGSYSCDCINKSIVKTVDVAEDDNRYKPIEKRYAPIIITFRTDGGNDLIFYGFRNDTDFIFFSTEKDVVIKPNETVIENYFNGLKGFEKQLLNRTSNPLYKNVFITPIETNETYVYVQRGYTWPSSYNYCININSSGFETFYNSLIQMATIYDETATNNLYGKMTHEAIKNFDWSYTKDYVDSDEEENMDGGEQMQKIIHFIGRVFDEGKQYIDGLKTNNKITNDSYCNIPDALLSDALEMRGWDVTSVVPLMENNSENKGVIELDLVSLKNATQNDDIKWFDTANIESSNSSNFDVKFMRRLLLSSKRIFQSKGTQEAIDMIMGMFGFGRKFNEEHEQDDNGDYKITEQWFEVTPKKYNEEVTTEEGNITTLGNLFISKNGSRGDYIDEGDEFINLPIKTIKRNNVEYIIPYYDKNETYEDINYNFYFQSKGGWGHKVDDKENIEGIVDNNFKKFEEYKETVSYLKVLSTVNDLLNVRTIETSLYDVYYVIDLSEAPNVFGTGTDYSHFFYVKDYGSTTNPETWGNIDIYSDCNSLDSNMLQLRKKALYLDSIINSSMGNNPHVGFGNYDDGATFYEYMANPFKGFIESGKLEELTDKEKEILTFSGFDKPFEEIYEYKNGERTTCKRKLYNDISNNSTGYKVNINSKVVCLENCMKSQDGNDLGMELFKKYFRRAMLPYIMQVIPSTTILILKNF